MQSTWGLKEFHKKPGMMAFGFGAPASHPEITRQ
jgi:hypothetical protein